MIATFFHPNEFGRSNWPNIWYTYGMETPMRYTHFPAINRTRKPNTALGLVLLFILALFPAQLRAFQVNFRDTVTFGDSLTHNDLLWFFSWNPKDMYGADPHEAVFDKAAIAGDDLTNYAIAGSTSDDIAKQINSYDFQRSIGNQEDATLIGFEIGGNDILNNVGLLKRFAPGENSSADAVIDRLIANVRSSLVALKEDHPPKTRFILWTIPDITFTPRYFGKLTQTEEDNLRAHTERVNRLLRKADRYSFLAVIDLYRVIQVLAVNPPTIKGQQLQGTPVTSEYDAVFADEIHPTAVSNALLANIIIKKVNAKWNDNIPLYSEDELAALAHIQ